MCILFRFKEYYKLTRIITAAINCLNTSVRELILLVFLNHYYNSDGTNLYINFYIVTLRLLFNV